MSLERLSAILTEASSIVETLKGAPGVPPPPVSRLLYSGVTHEYATCYPGNIDHRAFLLQHPNGFVGLHTDDGQLHKILPSFVNHGSQPRWSRKKPTVFRYLYLNELREFDVATDQTVTLKKFDLPNINGMGESDTSEDDDHIVLCSGQRVFVYRISKDEILHEFNADETFNNLYLSGDNLPIVGLYGRGVTLRKDSHYQTLTAHLCHMDTGTDSAGNPIMVWADGYRETFRLVKTNTSTGQSVDLAVFPWDVALHVSLPDRAKFAIVTSYSSKDSSPSKNELFRVWLDSVNGSHVDNLGPHGSNADIYTRQPKASVSPDGTRIVYDSNGGVFVMTV